MTIGERLLSLTVEYQDAVNSDRMGYGPHGAGRPIPEIAADYEAGLRELLA